MLIISSSLSKMERKSVDISDKTKTRILKRHSHSHSMSGTLKSLHNYSKTTISLSLLLDLKDLGANLAIDGEMTLPIIRLRAIFMSHLMNASVNER